MADTFCHMKKVVIVKELKSKVYESAISTVFISSSFGSEFCSGILCEFQF